MPKSKFLAQDYKRKLVKALKHLEYSFIKIQSLTEDVAQMDDEILETWESFSARFARVADLYLSRYVRAMVLEDDPGFAGTVRDFTNQGEKLGLVDDADAWMDIRELRNISAHEYTEEDLSEFFKKLKENAPKLLAVQKILQ